MAINGDMALINRRIRVKPSPHHTDHELGGSDEVHLDASQIVSGVLSLDRIPIIPYTKTNFADQDLKTISSPTFASINVGDVSISGNIMFNTPDSEILVKRGLKIHLDKDSEGTYALDVLGSDGTVVHSLGEDGILRTTKLFIQRTGDVLGAIHVKTDGSNNGLLIETTRGGKASWIRLLTPSNDWRLAGDSSPDEFRIERSSSLTGNITTLKVAYEQVHDSCESGWTLSANNGSASYDSTIYVEGSASIKLSASRDLTNPGVATARKNVNWGYRKTIRIMLKLDVSAPVETNPTFSILISSDGGSSYQEVFSLDVSSDSDWQEIKVNVNRKIDYIMFRVDATEDNSITAWIDDIYAWRYTTYGDYFVGSLKSSVVDDKVFYAVESSDIVFVDTFKINSDELVASQDGSYYYSDIVVDGRVKNVFVQPKGGFALTTYELLENNKIRVMINNNNIESIDILVVYTR